MYTSGDYRIRSLENQISEQQKLAWVMLLVGLAVGLVGMYVVVGRPANHELRTIKIELAQMQRKLEQLAAQGDQVWEANSLLSSLKAQQQQLEGARTALRSIRQLQSDVIDLTDRARFCQSQIKAISDLHDRIVQEQPSVEIAGRVLEDVSLLNDRLAAGKQRTQSASEALDQIIDLEDDLTAQTTRLDEAQSAARRMITLQEELCQAAAGLDVAWFGLQGLVLLKNSLMNGAQYVEIAQAIGDQLLTMQRRFAEEGGTSEIAFHRAQQLLKLNEILTLGDSDVQASRAKLETLIQLQAQISALPSMTEAVESLDLLVAFQDEFIDRIQILGEMRTSLVEIAIMESTIAKAVRTLQPLLQLGNLQRMSDAEIRSAARGILEERTTRLTNRPLNGGKRYDAETLHDAFVPQPQDGE